MHDNIMPSSNSIIPTSNAIQGSPYVDITVHNFMKLLQIILHPCFKDPLYILI